MVVTDQGVLQTGLGKHEDLRLLRDIELIEHRLEEFFGPGTSAIPLPLLDLTGQRGHLVLARSGRVMDRRKFEKVLRTSGHRSGRQHRPNMQDQPFHRGEDTDSDEGIYRHLFHRPDGATSLFEDSGPPFFEFVLVPKIQSDEGASDPLPGV